MTELEELPPLLLPVDEVAVARAAEVAAAEVSAAEVASAEVATAEEILFLPVLVEVAAASTASSVATRVAVTRVVAEADDEPLEYWHSHSLSTFLMEPQSDAHEGTDELDVAVEQKLLASLLPAMALAQALVSVLAHDRAPATRDMKTTRECILNDCGIRA